MSTVVDLSCQELVELVTEYFEGTLPAGERARFEHHLSTCDGCGAYVEQMQATVALLGHLPRAAVSPEAEAALLAAFRSWNAG